MHRLLNYYWGNPSPEEEEGSGSEEEESVDEDSCGTDEEDAVDDGEGDEDADVGGGVAGFHEDALEIQAPDEMHSSVNEMEPINHVQTVSNEADVAAQKVAIANQDEGMTAAYHDVNTDETDMQKNLEDLDPMGDAPQLVAVVVENEPTENVKLDAAVETAEEQSNPDIAEQTNNPGTDMLKTLENDSVESGEQNAAIIDEQLDTSDETTKEQQNPNTDEQTFYTAPDQIQAYEQITDDLVIPPPPTQITATTPLEQETPTEPDDSPPIEREEDAYPKAQDFLAEISVIETEEEVTIPPERAVQIIGFDDNEADTRTVLTSRTNATSVVRKISHTQVASIKSEKEKHEHQSLFDILDRNFEELGDAAGVSCRDVKLCFVAFVVVFAPCSDQAGGGVVHSGANGDLIGELTGDEGDEHEEDQTPPLQQAVETPKKVTRPNVPLAIAFALWRKVLRLLSDDDETTLSYIRSTLVLLGVLELSSIDREDAPLPPAGKGKHYSSCIECLRLHHDINQQYGEYLAQQESFKSTIESQECQWNNAVMEEASTMPSNEYIIQMLPLNTMRANHVQDTFDLLKDKSFVRKRIRHLGAQEAAGVHIRDVDELLRLIDVRTSSSLDVEMVDEQDGVLSAFDAMKKYCLHVTNELMKHTEEKEDTESVTVATLDKTTLSKIRNVGNALHLLGTSLGGYGFFDQEMEYYTEALRLKELCARGKVDFVSMSDTLHCMGFSLDNAGKSEEALDLYERALDIRLEYLGDDDLRVAETLHNKGALLCDEETSEEAMECLEEALRIRELHYGEEHESCADTMQWMGNLLRQYGDPSDALDYFKFALRIKQIRLGPDHVDVANTLFNTAVLLDDVEKYDLSLIAYKEACRIRKLVLGEKSLEVADTLFCLGNVATAMERHEEALEYFNESISIWEELIKDQDMYSDELDDSLLFISHPYSLKPELLIHYQKLNHCLEEVLPLTKLLVGSNHDDVCKLLNRMGDVYKKLHDWDNAIGSFQGALRVKRADEEMSTDDIEVATLLQKKGEVHLYKSEFSRAKSTFDASLQIREKLLGRDSNAYSSSLYCLGVAYHCLKDYSHSTVLFQECIRIQTKLLGKSDSRIAQSLSWLGRNYQCLHEQSKALEKFLTALQQCKLNKKDVDYRIVVMLLQTIGETYEHQKINLPDMALKCYIEEIHMIETKLDIEDPEVARLAALAHYKAGLQYQAKEDFDDSIEHLKQGLELIKQIEDNDEDATEAMISDTLGVLYASKEDHITAKQYYSESYSLYEKALGRDHATTSDSAFRLAQCLEEVGSSLALDFYLESLRVHRLHISVDDERVGTLLFAIGRMHFNDEAFADAVKSFDEALSTRRKLFGDSSIVADTYHQLANSHAQLNELEKAVIFYKESVRITKKFGDKTNLYKVSLDMATCCETMENYSLAIECYNDCLQATGELNDDTNIALILQSMGEIQMNKLHNYSDATKLFLDALELLRAQVAENNPESSHENECSVLGLMFQIGQVYALSKDYENALDFYEEHITLAESMEPFNEEIEELVANSLLEMGMILADMGDDSDFDLSIEKLKESLDIRRKVLGADNEQVADVLHKLAAVYEKSEEYNDAVKCLTEALRTFKMTNQVAKASATYHTLAKMKANAAEKSGSEADRKAAIECYEAAIDTRRQDPTLDDLDLASMLYEYATLLCLDNKYTNAMPLLEEALRIQKSKKGLRDERVANILLRTAECHVHDNKFDSSLVCLEQVIFIQDSLKSCKIDIVLLNHLLGITYLERGDNKKATAASLAALKMMKMESNQESLECADIYTNLGKAYGNLHEYDNAIKSLVEALRIQKVELGNDSIEYGETVYHLAEIHISTKKQAQALNCLNESIRVFREFVDEKRALVDALEMKADCHFFLEDYSTAASTFHECISVVKSVDFELDNERLASLMHKMGKSYANCNSHENAIASFRGSIKLFNQALGPDNLQVANVMSDVGVLTLNDSDNEKAAQCFKEVIRIYTLRDEEQNTKVADALVHLGTIHAANAEYEESMDSVKKAMRLYKEKFGDDSVEIGKALLLCSRLNDSAGDYDKMVTNLKEALRIFQATSTETDGMNVSIALSNLGVAYSRKQEYQEAVEKCKEALRIRKLHSDNDQDVADSLFNIGNLYDEWGKAQEAVPYLEGSLKLYRSLLGDDDLTIANVQMRLGTIYWKSRDLDQAIDSFSEALDVCEEVDEDVEHLLIPIYKGLGECYFLQGDLDLALESFAECLKSQKLELGDDCIDMAATCDSIGLVYQENSKHMEAIEFYKKSLQIYEHHYGKSSSQCLSAHVKISKALIFEELYENAIEHLNECIRFYSAENEDSSDVAMIHHQLGMAQKKLGKHEDAVVSLNKAIDMRTKIHGRTSLEVAETMFDLGDALEAHDLDEALTVFDEVISILNELPDSDHCKIADAYSRIAEILNIQGKEETSLTSLKHALKLYSEHGGSDSMKVAVTLVHLGSVYNNLDNLDKAIGCFSEGIKIFRSNPRERNTDNEILMSKAMGELGKIYARMKMHDKAMELCTESLKILKRHSSEENDGSVADTCLAIADILNEWGKVDQALRFYEEARKSYEEVLGLESREVATCHYGIAIIQKKSGDLQTALRSFGKALRIHRTKEGDKTLCVAEDLFHIGQIYDSFGETSKAYQCFLECLKIRQSNMGDDDLDLLAARRYVDMLRRKIEH